MKIGWQKLIKVLAPVLFSGAIHCGSVEHNFKFSGNSNLNYHVGKTDAEGKVSLNGRKIQVRNSVQALEDITVHYLADQQNELILAVEGRGNYFPKMEETSRQTFFLRETELVPDQFSSGNAPSDDSSDSSLDQVIYLEEGSGYRLTPQSPRKLLAEDENVNRYCLTLEQMQQDYIDVPFGLISLTGLSEEIEIAVTTPLKFFFERYVISRYGRHEAYEVRVPKITTNLCDENEIRRDQNILCFINTDSLSQRIWSQADIPLWEIRGSCNSFNQTNGNEQNEGYEPTNHNSNNQTTTYNCTLPSCIQYGEFTCQDPCVKRGNSCILPCESDADCQNEDFPLKCAEVNGENGCYLIPCADGCPSGTECLSFPDYGFQKLDNGAEPIALAQDLDSCYKRECLK